ncbi:hypothetical protein K470DRAFT_69336 [Piedraia hortae CBS 480.64]|uniref:Uncharacterized protein n=1 Tax=Piedraia hortae CBS 480.64 TaxID=1314780 RepID=A0A6A7C164_9PEZI|nr:hypothetical protein K470DRAFT_69336 [Piedraia hortae CBS 480.64]
MDRRLRPGDHQEKKTKLHMLVQMVRRFGPPQGVSSEIPELLNQHLQGYVQHSNHHANLLDVVGRSSVVVMIVPGDVECKRRKPERSTSRLSSSFAWWASQSTNFTIVRANLSFC